MQQRDTAGDFSTVRVERRGKSSPGCGRSHCHVNPIRSNTVTAEGERRPVAPFGARANGLCGLNRRATGGLDRLSSQQNPAYQPTHDKREEPFGSSLLYFPPFSPRDSASNLARGCAPLHTPMRGGAAPRPLHSSPWRGFQPRAPGDFLPDEKVTKESPRGVSPLGTPLGGHYHPPSSARMYALAAPPRKGCHSGRYASHKPNYRATD